MHLSWQAAKADPILGKKGGAAQAAAAFACLLWLRLSLRFKHRCKQPELCLYTPRLLRQSHNYQNGHHSDEDPPLEGGDLGHHQQAIVYGNSGHKKFGACQKQGEESAQSYEGSVQKGTW